jgi:hypothetical protein
LTESWSTRAAVSGACILAAPMWVAAPSPSTRTPPCARHQRSRGASRSARMDPRALCSRARTTSIMDGWRLGDYQLRVGAPIYPPMTPAPRRSRRRSGMGGEETGDEKERKGGLGFGLGRRRVCAKGG